jgi:hypothetical protein
MLLAFSVGSASLANPKTILRSRSSTNFPYRCLTLYWKKSLRLRIPRIKFTHVLTFLSGEKS